MDKERAYLVPLEKKTQKEPGLFASPSRARYSNDSSSSHSWTLSIHNSLINQKGVD